MTVYDLPFTRFIVGKLEKSTTRLLDAFTVFIYTLIALSWINSIIWWAA